MHVISHVFAARALVPKMLARGSGYLLNTASAAGLLASLNSMPYGVTKNAAVALAERLAFQYGKSAAVRVSVLCPQSVQTGVATPARRGSRRACCSRHHRGDAGRALSLLSHPTVADMQRKATDRDRCWLSGMRRLRDKIYGPQGTG